MSVDCRTAISVAEDSRSAVAYIDAVHSVGTCACSRKRSVEDGQLAAFDRDQCLAVEVLAVCRTRDLAVAGDRQVAAGNNVEQHRLVGAYFMSVKIQSDLLVYGDAFDLDISKQLDCISIFSIFYCISKCSIVICRVIYSNRSYCISNDPVIAIFYCCFARNNICIVWFLNISASRNETSCLRINISIEGTTINNYIVVAPSSNVGIKCTTIDCEQHIRASIPNIDIRITFINRYFSIYNCFFSRLESTTIDYDITDVISGVRILHPNRAVTFNNTVIDYNGVLCSCAIAE